MRRAPLALVLAFAALAAAVPAAQSYVPHRVVDATRGALTDFEAMLADLTRADVVFLGEQHDDRNTHRLELAVLEGLSRRRGELVLSLEMFERDAQEPLEHFLLGHASEAEFLAVARPWPRYATDYKPLVDFAASLGWPIVAANVPRPIASEVSKTGLAALDAKPETERGFFAAELVCPTDDDYFTRFAAAMGGHPTPTATGAPPAGAAAADDRARTERYYFAQCLKDETMAESIARAHAAGAAGGKRPLVVHVNGAFHSDFGAGTAERVRRRLPDARVAIVTFVPVADLDAVTAAAATPRRADYLVYTVRGG